jgi:hypothetical protein
MKTTAPETYAPHALRSRARRAVRVRFYALDGTLCVLIEADSEEDARYLCRDFSFEFIGLCER